MAKPLEPEPERAPEIFGVYTPNSLSHVWRVTGAVDLGDYWQSGMRAHVVADTADAAVLIGGHALKADHDATQVKVTAVKMICHVDGMQWKPPTYPPVMDEGEEPVERPTLGDA